MLAKIKEKLVKKLSKDLLNKSYLIKQLKEYKSYKILDNELYSMILGVLIGTYSSIFIASPILKYLKVSSKTLEKKEEEILP